MPTEKMPARKQAGSLGRGFETFILVSILLVILQTLFAEIANFLHWTVQVRTVLLIAGFYFDLLFTVEFVSRSVRSARSGSYGSYLIRGRGWVDFLSSIPLLLLNSGPSLFLLITGVSPEAIGIIGVLNILKVVKAIRITRVLRLIRIMKIFGKIRNAESPMAQHHTTTVATTAVAVVVFVMIIFTVSLGDPTTELLNERVHYYQGFLQRLLVTDAVDEGSRRDVIDSLLRADPHVLRLNVDGERLFSGVDQEEWVAYYGPDDYIKIRNSGYTLFVSVVDINEKSSFQTLMVFAIILALVGGFMVFYSKHFVQTISDVIFILHKGFRLKSYSLQVKIPGAFRDHEVFQLARFYNEKFLPAKMRRIHEKEQEKKSDLSMEDLLSFKDTPLRESPGDPPAGSGFGDQDPSASPPHR
jgi:hypothetical protein